MLRLPHSFFSLYQYKDIKRRVLQIYPDMPEGIIGVEQYLKHISETQEEKLRLKIEGRRARRKENQK